ncbi:cytochrome P450 2F3-like [Paramacrobiotus metropolitanus]|uniref:cytochrome P450 2F3-like n=1 Tax=Paramacrobiotus metropolitanus TaxID=2943436 RepID=UPI002445C3A3|nr:cytochrome P450 2F3-like [Paramacrobiotus metropolitanus]
MPLQVALSMACVTAISAFLVGFFHFLDRLCKTHNWTRKARRGLPPGPHGWPVLGNMLVMCGEAVHGRLQELGKRFQGMFTLRLDFKHLFVICRKVIMLTSYQRFREFLVDHAWEFAGRPPELHFDGVPVKGNVFLSIICLQCIVAAGMDEDARAIRKFTLVTLRSFGFGKTSMQDTMLLETTNLLDALRQHTGRPLNPRTPIANASANVIAGVLLGKTFPHGTDGFRDLMDSLLQGVEVMTIKEQNLYLPFLKPFLKKKYQQHLGRFLYGIGILADTVKEHVGIRVSGLPRDFIDCWLQHAEQSAKGPFDQQHLTSVVFDMFTGGFETTCSTILWVMSMMLHHPDIQLRMQKEIDNVVRADERVTLEHRDQLVYTEAVILETMRKYPLLPFSVPHASTMDTSVAGYHIPEGTRVMVHVYSIHHDPALWTDPATFRPERFITANQTLTVPEFFIPFGAGRRSCIGEQLARKELFLFIANILHTFRIRLPEAAALPSLQGSAGVVFYPPPFEVVLEERSG